MRPFAFNIWNSTARLNRIGKRVFIFVLKRLSISWRTNSRGNDGSWRAFSFLRAFHGWIEAGSDLKIRWKVHKQYTSPKCHLLSHWKMVTPRSTKLYQNLLTYQVFFLLSIPIPTLGPTLYCCLIGDLGCVFVVKAGAINDSCQLNQELDWH